MEAISGIEVFVLLKPSQKRIVKRKVNAEESLRFMSTTGGEVDRLVRPPWRVWANGEGSWYAQQNVVRQHVDFVK